MVNEPFYQKYEQSGYFFSRELLTTYCLSLYTKPFVILSGISGTGKTKIAQLFNAALIQPPEREIREISNNSSERWIIMKITAGLWGGDGRGNFQYSDLNALLEQEEIEEIQPRIDELARAGLDDNICEPFEFHIDTPHGEQLKAKAYLQRASSPLLRVRFKSKRNEEYYDSTEYFARHYNVGDILKLQKIGKRHLKIVVVNEDNAIEIARNIEVKDREEIDNKCFVSVRPDWTDSTSLFGYYNLIEQKYHITPLLRFILQAKEYPDIPFFLILDEMNLAKVEHYFSDFLSCLESRYWDGDILKQEAIHIHSDSGFLDTNDDYFDLIESSIELPENLFVTGTVNIDESTYMFSPKVLDRANVIEINEVDIERYFGNDSQAGVTKFLLETLPAFKDISLPSRRDFQRLPVVPQRLLIQVHKALEQHHLHFGYRVINEISRYILNAKKYCEHYDGLENDALDFQLLQKVFPKLTGSQSELEEVIGTLINILKNNDESGDPGIEAEPLYPRSIKKLQRMQRNLALHGFASFIE